MKQVGKKVVAVLLLGILIAVVPVMWLWWANGGIFWLANQVKAHAALSLNPPRLAEPLSMTDLGQLGDLFGALNTFFAGLAFVGVAFAAWQQFRVLAMTRDQLAMTREQLTMTKDQLAIALKQEKLEDEQNRRHSFEPLFFQLLNRHENLVKDLRVTHPLEGLDGDVNDLGSIFRRNANRMAASRGTNFAASSVVAEYQQLYRHNEAKLGAYYRSLYHLFRLVEKAQFNEEAKVDYANITRATLGSDELFLLALNCLTPQGSGFKELVEKFGVLKHMSDDSKSPDLAHQALQQRFSPDAWLSYPQRVIRRKGRNITSKAEERIEG